MCLSDNVCLELPCFSHTLNSFVPTSRIRDCPTFGGGVSHVESSDIYEGEEGASVPLSPHTHLQKSSEPVSLNVCLNAVFCPPLRENASFCPCTFSVPVPSPSHMVRVYCNLAPLWAPFESIRLNRELHQVPTRETTAQAICVGNCSF